MKYDGVIFDKDGVLLDSMSNSFKWADEMRVKMARELGKEIDMDDSKQIVTASTIEELDEAIEQTGLDGETIREMEEEIAKRKIEKMKEGELELFSETREVLNSLDLPKSVVSNAPEQATVFTVKKFDLEDHFEKVLSPSLNDIRSFVRRKKPSPEMIEEAMESMDVENPVMVGDSEDDVRAAENAGIDSIFVNRDERDDLNPTHQVDSLKEILKHIK